MIFIRWNISEVSEAEAMLGLGLAVSHAPSMFRGLEHLAADSSSAHGRRATATEIEGKPRRSYKGISIESDLGFEALKQPARSIQARCLLVVGDDQRSFTEANMPTYCLFTCARCTDPSTSGSSVSRKKKPHHAALRFRVSASI